jgi:hypothetical protein
MASGASRSMMEYLSIMICEENAVKPWLRPAHVFGYGVDAMIRLR